MKSIFLLLATAANVLWICSTLSGQPRPNIIFILTDDQSYGYMGCTGNKMVQTPHLDQLAGEGTLFTNAYITSGICTPSRISILLSQFERKHNVNFNSGTSISPEAWAQSYPVILRKAGYYTGWVGKNHAPVGEGGYESGLMEKSFDYWYAGHGHLTFYPKERHAIFNDAKSDTQVEVIEEGIQDFLDPNEVKMDSAIQFLDHRPVDQPFMLSICFNLPHSAGTRTMKMKASDDAIYKTLYRKLKIPLPKNYIAKSNIKTPKLPSDLFKVENRQTGYDYVDTPDSLIEIYIRQLQSMTGIDRLVGNLRKKLQTLGIDENTIIIFSSDHGLFMGEYGIGGKALCYQKVTHVPLIIYDPRVPENAKGQVSDALVQSIDIAPTMLAMAKIEIPSGFQGNDMSPLVYGNQEPIRSYIFTENLWSTQFGNPRCEAIQDKEWKYIRYYRNDNLPALQKIKTAKELGMNINTMLYAVHDSDIALYRSFIESPIHGETPVYEELYHLKVDPLESNNLIQQATYHEELTRLRSAWTEAIKNARGEGNPKVVRYTYDSKLEGNNK